MKETTRQNRASRAMVRQLFKHQVTDEERAEEEASREKMRQDAKQADTEEYHQRVEFAREVQATTEAHAQVQDEKLRALLMRPWEGEPRRAVDDVREKPPSHVDDLRENHPSHVDGEDLPPQAVKILATLKSWQGGLSRSQVRRLVFGDNVPAALIGKWLDCLLGRGLVEFETIATPGRHAEIWRAKRKRRKG
jgi:hypothetical protein